MTNKACQFQYDYMKKEKASMLKAFNEITELCDKEMNEDYLLNAIKEIAESQLAKNPLVEIEAPKPKLDW